MVLLFCQLPLGRVLVCFTYPAESLGVSFLGTIRPSSCSEEVHNKGKRFYANPFFSKASIPRHNGAVLEASSFSGKFPGIKVCDVTVES